MTARSAKAVSRRPPRPARRTSTVRPPRPGGGPRRLYTRLRRAWDRPLTAYYLILGGSLLILVLGLVMVYSASQIKALQSGLAPSYFFRKQLLAAAIGGVLLLAAARLRVRLHRAMAYPLLVGSVFLMCLVQIPGIGVSVNGNRNWLNLGGPFQMQPSEFGKLALVLWGADLLARKQGKKLLTQWKQLLVPLTPVAFLLLGLIMLGGDMGTAIILTAILFGLLWLAGAPTRLFTGVLGGAVAIGALLILTSANRMSRLACIGATDPGPGDQCWQAVHGIYALASGGFFGSGLGASMEKWGELPEPHTDFIFAITGEELGLAGTLSVLALFAALGYAGIRVAGRTEDPFVRYAAGGVTTWIMAQAVINIGAVLGLLPIAGVPLPLFSYGGSALLPTMFAVGLLIAFARDEPAARAALAALAERKPGFGRRSAGVRWKTMRRRVMGRPSGER
ncbi:putative lipid II flippase FtsW [Streptomyces natalensis]|uniref:Probable peptidoglycan glycosyltransferase FtsW n=1 Tax=Streptomyces natalensis ATCC 27448 TaxID=1240678 RepID=A0A0D7CPX0_9ACTN|nr:putative lipid II flippase FtsW [Streptomyces natalensis]KIZ18243.1 cell division protein FtsW [Streptomyces natalensis ATCC 27448]